MKNEEKFGRYQHDRRPEAEKYRSGKRKGVRNTRDYVDRELGSEASKGFLCFLKFSAFTVFLLIPMEGGEVGGPHVRFEADNRT